MYVFCRNYYNIYLLTDFHYPQAPPLHWLLVYRLHYPFTIENEHILLVFDSGSSCATSATPSPLKMTKGTHFQRFLLVCHFNHSFILMCRHHHLITFENEQICSFLSLVAA